MNNPVTSILDFSEDRIPQNLVTYLGDTKKDEGTFGKNYAKKACQERTKHTEIGTP